MMAFQFNSLVTFTGLLISWLCTAGLAGATLQLGVHSSTQPPFTSGDSVAVVLSMSDLGMNEAAGYQAFLTFDTSELTFLGGSYTSEPFGLPIISIIEADDDEIDLAAGIDSVNSQEPTSDDAVLAMLFFEAQQDFCLPTVNFRANTPPTQISNEFGEPILPLTLNDLMAMTDCNDNGVADSCDIASGTSDDSNRNGIPDECDECVGDLNADGVVDGSDLGLLLGNWNQSGVGDLNNSGTVDGSDLGLLLGNWGPCP